MFTCPFEEQACGPKSDWMLDAPEELISIQSRALFKKDKVCYYSISTPPTANPGDYLYLSMVSLVNTEAFITITKSMTETAPVYCAIAAGTTLVARHPDKFFISFKSKVIDGSKFFINAYYSPTLTSDAYQNAQMCSDGGRSVLVEPPEPSTDPTSAEAEEEVCLTDACLNGTDPNSAPDNTG